MNDLQIRLLRFASAIYKLTVPYQKELYLEPTIRQILKSSTSVGANYSEAQSSSSYKDFLNKVKIAQKELKETEYWIKFLKDIKNGGPQFDQLEKESIELQKILATIAKKADYRLKSGGTK